MADHLPGDDGWLLGVELAALHRWHWLCADVGSGRARVAVQRGTVRNLGQLLAAYMIVYYFGTVAGQLLVSKLSTELLSVIPWVTSLVFCAVSPLVFTRVSADGEMAEAAPGRIWPMLRRRSSHLGINGCIISGIVLGSLYGLMLLYLLH